jgi:rhodanese-related sulfurtransferase
MIPNGTTSALVLSALLWLAGSVTAAGAAQPDADAAFPLRAQYQDVPVIGTGELAKRFNDVVIVDVRSRYEYDTLRIVDAQLIPVGDARFLSQVRELRAKSDKPVVFYCNGKTCRKSYEAVRQAQAMRIKNVLCYDAGVADWAAAYPERAALLGASPVRTDALISPEKFRAHLLEPAEFESKVGAGAIVVDVRDRSQRDNPLFPFKEERIQLEDTARIDALIEQARRERKTLLAYDAVGRQVEWLQYRLESKGFANYYFMNGGAQAYTAAHGQSAVSR